MGIIGIPSYAYGNIDIVLMGQIIYLFQLYDNKHLTIPV